VSETVYDLYGRQVSLQGWDKGLRHTILMLQQFVLMKYMNYRHMDNFRQSQQTQELFPENKKIQLGIHMSVATSKLHTSILV
jgi:hypothetical protein